MEMLMEEETERAEFIEAEALDAARQYAIAFVWALVGFGIGMGAVRAVTVMLKPQHAVAKLLLGLIPFQLTAPLAAVVGKKIRFDPEKAIKAADLPEAVLSFQRF